MINSFICCGQGWKGFGQGLNRVEWIYVYVNFILKYSDIDKNTGFIYTCHISYSQDLHTVYTNILINTLICLVNS